MRCYDRQRYLSAALLEQHTADPKVGCLSIAAWVLQLLGYPDQALQSIQQALTLAQQLSHPFSLAYAQAHAAVVHQLRREAPAAQEMAEAAMAVATRTRRKRRLRCGGRWAVCCMGGRWRSRRRRRKEVETRQAVAAWRAPGAELAVPYWSALLVEACRYGGEVARGCASWRRC